MKNFDVLDAIEFNPDGENSSMQTKLAPFILVLSFSALRQTRVELCRCRGKTSFDWTGRNWRENILPDLSVSFTPTKCKIRNRSTESGETLRLQGARKNLPESDGKPVRARSEGIGFDPAREFSETCIHARETEVSDHVPMESYQLLISATMPMIPNSLSVVRESIDANSGIPRMISFIHGCAEDSERSKCKSQPHLFAEIKR